MPDTKTLTLSREEARRIFFEWYLIYIAKDPGSLSEEDKQLAERLKDFLKNN